MGWLEESGWTHVRVLPSEPLSLDWLPEPKWTKAMDLRATLALSASRRPAALFSTSPQRRALVLCQNSGTTDRQTLRPLFPISVQTGWRTLYRRSPPLRLLQSLPNMSAAHCALQWTCQGPVSSLPGDPPPLSSGWELIDDLFASREAEEVLWIGVDCPAAESSTEPATAAAAWFHPELWRHARTDLLGCTSIASLPLEDRSSHHVWR